MIAGTDDEGYGGETRQTKSRCTWCHGNGYVTKTVRND